MHEPKTQSVSTTTALESGPRFVVESLVSLTLAVMLVRAFAVEGYIISTGSMAPYLLGYHKQVVCPACGFAFAVGVPIDGELTPENESVTCPSCGQPDIDLSHVPRNEGDQLLVHKSAYLLRRPQRWEPVVFQNPNRPTQAYVKRVAGLPGESVKIATGDLWINGELVRKNLSAQRSTRMAIGSQLRRADPAEGSRWDFGSGWRLRTDGFEFSPSDRQSEISWLAYHGLTQGRRSQKTELNWPLDDYGYNGLTEISTRYVVRDLMVAGHIVFERGRGDFAVSMTDGWQTFEVRLSASQRRLTLLSDGRDEPLDSAMLSGTLWKTPLLLEMSLFDRQLLFALDGKTIFVQKLPVRTKEDGPDRVGLNGGVPVRIGARDLHVTIGDLTLYRDVYYTRGDGRHGVNEPYRLGPDEYFFLGDNSPISLDSRSWTQAVVHDHMLIGKPFLVHLPSRPGRVKVGSAEWHLRVPDGGRIRYIR